MSIYFRTFLLSLGALEELRKATVSFVISVHLYVCPSFRMEQFCFLWSDFYKKKIDI